MADAELRGRLLTHFYGLRYSNGGFVPVNDLIVSGTDSVTLEAIGGVCRQLGEAGLIEWTGYLGRGPVIGTARITGQGVDAVERGGSASLEIRFPDNGAPITTAVTKEPERINLPEGLAVLANYLPAADAKVRLRDAFVRKACSHWPRFALSYDEAEIDWTTGSVKIPRKREAFIPTFSRAELNAYFLETRPAALKASSETTKTLSTPSAESAGQREVLTLKPAFMGMSIDLKELAQRVIAWWKARQ